MFTYKYLLIKHKTIFICTSLSCLLVSISHIVFMINEEYLNISINYCVSNTFGSHRTQSIKKDAFRYPLLSVLKMSTGCSILLDVHSKPSLASSISDPCFIILLLLCADSSRVEIIFSLQSNFNNPVIFFSLYYSSVLNQMRGFFFFPVGLTIHTFKK